MATGFALVILTLLMAAGLAACGSNSNEEESTRPTATPSLQQSPTATPSTPAGVLQVINRDLGGSGEYRFDPAEFTFTEGQKVTFAIVAETEFHTFTVDELEIDVEIEAGETEMFTYTFDKPGTYELICIPHQAQGMVGEIVVE